MWYRALVIVGATGARAPADIQQWVTETRSGKGAILKNSKNFSKTKQITKTLKNTRQFHRKHTSKYAVPFLDVDSSITRFFFIRNLLKNGVYKFLKKCAIWDYQVS